MLAASIIGAFVPPIPPAGAHPARAPQNGRAMTRTPRRRTSSRPTPRTLAALRTDDRGAATAEYAIATMAAVGFASLLVVIMQSDEVRGILTDLVRTALTVGG
jgi:Flp pilus assembly pilin Flp